MKRLITPGLIAVALLVGLLVVQGQSQQPKRQPDRLRPNNVKAFMRVKLKHAQEVLEGLTLEDHDKIAKHAQELSLLSLESNWQVLQTPEYLTQSSEFRRTTQRMRDAAKKKNLDGATLAFAEMTVKCVNCHKYVRKYSMAQNNSRKPKKESAAGGQ